MEKQADNCFEPSSLIDDVKPLMDRVCGEFEGGSPVSRAGLKYQAVVWVMCEASLDEPEKITIINNIIRYSFTS